MEYNKGVKEMEISLSSNNYKIINSGQTFLFEPDSDFSINITADNDFDFSIVIRFKNDTLGEQRIEKNVKNNTIQLICWNFDSSGTGISKPICVARIDGRELYFMFWSYLEGNGTTRSVKYTIFQGIDRRGDIHAK